MRVLGIDPGSIHCGFGVVEKQGAKLVMVEYDVIKAKKNDDRMEYRLKEIYTALQSVIERTKPDITAFEQTFFAKNAQSLIKLAQARAAAILAASMNKLPVFEYAPNEIKKSVTGKGRASKEQVQFMVRNLLKLKDNHTLFDASDALAVAICHIMKGGEGKEKSSSWEQFVKKNPHRVASLK